MPETFTTALDTTRSVSSSSTLKSSSAIRVVDLLESVNSYGNASASSVSRTVDLVASPSSWSAPGSAASSRVVSLLESVSSHAAASGTDVSILVDLLAPVESHSAAGSSSPVRVTDVLAATFSHSNSAGSTSSRGGISFEGRESSASHLAACISRALRVIDLLEGVESSVAISGGSADRGALDYEGRESDFSFSDTLDSGSIRIVDLLEGVGSYSKSMRSSVINDRTSLELVDHEITWVDDEGVWYTNWFQESRLLGQEDNLAIRSLVVPDAKEPAAVVQLQYDGNGDGEVDETSERIDLGRDQLVKAVNGVPIDEDGYYRIKIMEYSGYNSLYDIDTAIIH